jgi:hypothetical protein
MKQKRQVVVLVVLLVVAGLVWFWYFERRKPAATTGVVSAAQNFQLLSVENPQLHKDRLDAARRTEYKTKGRNIFSAIAPPPPEPPRPPRRDLPGPKLEAPLPPPSLPSNMKFFGYGTVPNGTARRAFFTDGEDVYIIGEGEVFLNRYRILKVGNANLEFEEVTSGRHGTATLEEQGTGPSA